MRRRQDTKHDAPRARQRGPSRRSLLPFMLGTVIGGVGGAVVGVLLGKQLTGLIGGLIGIIDRRLSDGDRDDLRFELLLQ